MPLAETPSAVPHPFHQVQTLRDVLCLIFCEKPFEKSWKKKIAAGENSYFRKAIYRIHANVGRGRTISTT
jgi:hypothetical protein